MTRLRRASVIATLFLLTCAATASAECAWVLWWEDTSSFFSSPRGQSDYFDNKSWNILGSYPTIKSCEQQQEWKIGQMLKGWQKEKAEAKFGLHTINHEAGANIIGRRDEFKGGESTSNYYQTIRYLCLPDSVDPRGPKGN
jgi:hypothetical protein